jgi:hypothetical protein
MKPDRITETMFSIREPRKEVLGREPGAEMFPYSKLKKTLPAITEPGDDYGVHL